MFQTLLCILLYFKDSCIILMLLKQISAKKSNSFFLRVNSNCGGGEIAFNFKGQKSGEKTINISIPYYSACCSTPSILKEVFYWRNWFSCWDDDVLVCIASSPQVLEDTLLTDLFIYLFIRITETIGLREKNVRMCSKQSLTPWHPEPEFLSPNLCHIIDPSLLPAQG